MNKINNETIIKTKEQLIDWFHLGLKDKEEWKIGTEHEKFAYRFDKRLQKYRSVSYFEENGIKDFLNDLSTYGWEKVKEKENVIALRKNNQSITLEPGGQIELSGAPLKSIHETCKETNDHLELVKRVGENLGIILIGAGARPIGNPNEIDWMPKERYKIMKNYMPKKGNLGLQMMSSTCTVQVNLDYKSENDMIRKFRIGLSLQPIITGLFANSPLSEGKLNGFLSWRRKVWSDTDPDRCGILPMVFDKNFGFESYVEYALKVPMYFVVRDGKFLDCSGNSFENFIKGKLDLLPGEYPTMVDWENHLTTIFTEVRLKHFLEMRGADAGSWKRICALPAFWSGILYDENSLECVEEICSKWTNEDRENMAKNVPKMGLNAKISNSSLFDVAKELLSISTEGLKRRNYLDGAGNDESGYLEELYDIVLNKKTPAEKLVENFQNEWKGDTKKLLKFLSY